MHPEGRKGDRRLGRIVRGKFAHRRGFPDGRRDPMPERAGRRSGAGKAIGLPLGGRRVRARVNLTNSVQRLRCRPSAVSRQGSGAMPANFSNWLGTTWNQETGGMKSYGGFGIYVGLGPNSAIRNQWDWAFGK